MSPTICICCGEPMAKGGHPLSRNPNMCACCSSLADGMDESAISTISAPAEPKPARRSPAPELLSVLEAAAK